jgi:hypothetical protein
MTVVGIFAILMTLLAIGIGCKPLTIERLGLFVFIAAIHLGACLYYCAWSQKVVADASSYYYDPYHFSNGPWGFASVFVVKFCHLLKSLFGATYLDCFLLFQTLGFLGLMILARTFSEIQTNVGVPEHRGYLLLLCLPSVNFWTSAIGKDAPIFFAISLTVWFMLRPRQRWPYFVLALAVMVAFRAHIAMLTAMALAAAAVLGSSISFGRKAGILTVAVVGLLISAKAVESTFDVDATNVGSVTDFIGKQNETFGMIGGSTSLGNAPIMLRVVSLLFRPFFFDAHGFLGVIASIENVGVVLGFLYTIAHWRELSHLSKRVFFVKFILIYLLLMLVLLTIIYYNVGLGLRERVMAYPMIYAMLVSLWSMRRKFAKPEMQQFRRGLIAPVKTDSPLPEH